MCPGKPEGTRFRVLFDQSSFAPAPLSDRRWSVSDATCVLCCDDNPSVTCIDLVKQATASTTTFPKRPSSSRRRKGISKTLHCVGSSYNCKHTDIKLDKFCQYPALTAHLGGMTHAQHPQHHFSLSNECLGFSVSVPLGPGPDTVTPLFTSLLGYRVCVPSSSEVSAYLAASTSSQC